MKLLLALTLSISLSSCVTGESADPVTGTGDEHGAGTGGGGGGGGGAGVHITANTTWTGTVEVVAATTIDPGVTLSVAPGAVVRFKAGATLRVAGTLDAQGTSAAKVAFVPAAQTFGPIVVPSGGNLTLRYVTMTGAAIRTEGNGSANIADSELSNVIGDLLVMNGGTMKLEYSNVGIEGGTDTTHCNMHFETTDPNAIQVTHSTIRGVDYGVMFYSGTGANFTYNNWNNNINVDVKMGVTGDFRNSYFKGLAPPTTSGITVTTPALTTALPACNGTNDATCAGPRP